jgi:hypothetical protein
VQAKQVLHHLIHTPRLVLKFLWSIIETLFSPKRSFAFITLSVLQTQLSHSIIIRWKEILSVGS